MFFYFYLRNLLLKNILYIGFLFLTVSLYPINATTLYFGCDMPEYHFTIVDDKRVCIQYCAHNNEVSYAEIYEPYTFSKNSSKLDAILDDFFSNGLEILTISKEEKALRKSQAMPRFLGCEYLIEQGLSFEEIEMCSKKKMLEYIYGNLIYPPEALTIGAVGTASYYFYCGQKWIHCGYVVSRDPGYGMGESAKKVIESMNGLEDLWIPGIQDYEPINVIYNMPVKFKLQ